MNLEESKIAAERIAGYWPWWRATTQQIELVHLRLGSWSLSDVLDAIREHAATDPMDGGKKGRRPNLQQIEYDLLNKFRGEIPSNDRWTWGDETELSLLQRNHWQAGHEWPGDDYAIRQLMHREPPPKHVRKQVQEAMVAAGCKRWPDVYQTQESHIQSRAAAEKRLAEKAKAEKAARMETPSREEMDW